MLLDSFENCWHYTRLTSWVHTDHRLNESLYKNSTIDMNKLRRTLYLMLFSLFFLSLSACTVQQKNPIDAQRTTLTKKHSQLQLQFSQLTDEWWQRTDQLVNTQSSLSPNANNLIRLKEINQSLATEIDLLKTNLSHLNNKIITIKKRERAGVKITFTLEQGRWNDVSSINDRPLYQMLRTPDSFTIIAGEQIAWQPSLSNEYTSTATLLDIKIILSEKGRLYIEDRKVADINIDSISPIQLTKIAVFNQQPFPVGYLNMTLIPNLID